MSVKPLLTTRRPHLGLLLPWILLPLIGLSAWLTTGCAGPGPGNSVTASGKGKGVAGVKVQSVNLSSLVAPKVTDDPVAISTARNESTSFQIQVSGIPAPQEKVVFSLRLQPLNL